MSIGGIGAELTEGWKRHQAGVFKELFSLGIEIQTIFRIFSSLSFDLRGPRGGPIKKSSKPEKS